MIWKNIEIYNVAELFEENGGVYWHRTPCEVGAALEGGKQAANMNRGSTGVELRFCIKGDRAILRMAARHQSNTLFHIYRGGLQGNWFDHESVPHLPKDGTVVDVVIEKSKNGEMLHRMAAASHDPFDPDVVRVIFDRGAYTLYDVCGDVTPPTAAQCPAKTILFYGSSITHGSNSLDISHSFASVIGRRLRMDVRNLGFAGSCLLEPAMAEYIASEGEKGKWDMAVLEVGINALKFDNEKIAARVTNLLQTVAGRNKEKPVVIISPFYCGNDFCGSQSPTRWRTIVSEVVRTLGLANVTELNGLSLLDHISLLSADEVHPNIDGVAQIASRLAPHLQRLLAQGN